MSFGRVVGDVYMRQNELPLSMAMNAAGFSFATKRELKNALAAMTESGQTVAQRFRGRLG